MADDIKIVGLSSKKSGGTNWKVISAIIGIVVLSIGVIAGIYLVRENQNINEEASGNCDNPASIVQCPAPDGNLYSCNPPDQNNNAQISRCDVAGRRELCGIGGGVKEYCCPSAGGAWTTDMTACSCAATAPTNLTVENISGTSVKLKWTAGSGGTETRLWVSKNTDPVGGCSTGGAANCITNDQKFTSTNTEYVVTGLLANTKYYWRMMTSAGSGCDSGTSVLNFTTQTDTNLPSCGSAVPNCYASTVVGTVACNDGQKTVYCCKPGQTSQNNTCTDGGVTTGGVCDTNISLRGGCATGLNCQKDNENIFRCSSTSATATSTSASKTATPTATSTTKATATATSAGKTATPTSTAKASSTATAKATASGSATAFPVPETGAEWPTVIGAGFGIVMLLVSLALAL